MSCVVNVTAKSGHGVLCGEPEFKEVVKWIGKPEVFPDEYGCIVCPHGVIVSVALCEAHYKQYRKEEN